MAINTWTGIGRLTADPELRHTNEGTPVASFTIAVDRPTTNSEGKHEVDYIPIVVWRKQAEICAQYLAKGRLVGISGRLQIRTYENREGQKVKVAEIVASDVQFMSDGSNHHTATENVSGGSRQPSRNPQPVQRYEDDPFVDDGISTQFDEEDLPF